LIGREACTKNLYWKYRPLTLNSKEEWWTDFWKYIVH
jgi:hypothetical protein